MSNDPMHPPITDLKVVKPRPDMAVVVLERIEVGPFGDVITPEYCIHGKTTCYGCREWCWLGDKTHEAMMSGDAVGLCLQCAHTMLPKDVRPERNLNDHRRTDGPH